MYQPRFFCSITLTSTFFFVRVDYTHTEISSFFPFFFFTVWLRYLLFVVLDSRSIKENTQTFFFIRAANAALRSLIFIYNALFLRVSIPRGEYKVPNSRDFHGFRRERDVSRFQTFRAYLVPSSCGRSISVPSKDGESPGSLVSLGRQFCFSFNLSIVSYVVVRRESSINQSLFCSLPNDTNLDEHCTQTCIQGTRDFRMNFQKLSPKSSFSLSHVCRLIYRIVNTRQWWYTLESRDQRYHLKIGPTKSAKVSVKILRAQTHTHTRLQTMCQRVTKNRIARGSLESLAFVRGTVVYDRSRIYVIFAARGRG